MVSNAISFGLALVLVGLYGYFGYDPQSLTALIPAVVGIVLIVAGLAVLEPTVEIRRNAMHASAGVALIGAIAAWGYLAAGGIYKPAVWMLLLMGFLCTAFVGLCVKSFIDAKKAREASQHESLDDENVEDMESASTEDASVAIEDGDEE